MRHALEPDHLAALSTLLTGERNVRKAAWLGVYWGIGHTLTLLVAGTLLVVLRADMPAIASARPGVRRRAAAGGVRLPRDLPVGRPGFGGPDAFPRARSAVSSCVRRPMDARPATAACGRGPRVGGQWRAHRAGHGDDPVDGARLIYLVLFGVGSTLGMAALSGLMGWPIARVGAHGAVARCVSLAVGCISIMLGLCWGYPLIGRLL